MGLSGDFVPRFAKRYAALGENVRAAVKAFGADVRARRFPGPEHIYPLVPNEAPGGALFASIQERTP